MSAPRPRPLETLRKCARVVWLAMCKYSETDGELRAASFAYYAFFALFPLLLLLISIGSMFVDPEAVQGKIVTFVDEYLPVAAELVNTTIGAVLKTRGSAGFVALLGLGWSSLRFFQSLVHGVNRAWGTHEIVWWRLPLKNLAMIGIVASALVVGVIAPVILKYIEWYSWEIVYSVSARVMVFLFKLLEWIFATAVLFYGFSMFYKFAPRRKTAFSEVWFAAAAVAIGLQVVRDLFVLYVLRFANFNMLYGTLGGVVALLMWIYLSGSIIIFGGCLSAAQAEIKEAGEE